MSIEQIHRQEKPQQKSEAAWVFVEVNGQLHIHTPDDEELDILAPPLVRLRAMQRRINNIERKMQRGEGDETLSFEHGVFSGEYAVLRLFCVDAGLIPDTI